MGRVLHLINTAGPGGAETVYLNLVETLDRERWGSVVVVPEVDWLTDQLTARGHSPIIEVCKGRFDLGYLWRLVHLIRRGGVDVVHAHLFGPTVEASIIGWLTGVPVVCTLHGKGDLSSGERFRKAKFELINRGADRVVFVSESLRRYFLAQGSLRPELTVVIPNGIDLSRRVERTASARRDLGLPEDCFVVGAVGNLRPVKRYDLLIRAAALLNASSPDYHFVIVGQAPPDIHSDLVALRDSLGLQNVVRFAGFQDEVEKFMSTFDLFALSSDSEGFSIATVQAMAAGLPIVATRCGGPEEILDHGRSGWLVDCGDPGTIADAIRNLRADADRRASLGRAAKAEAELRFSLASQVSSYEGLYDTVIRERLRGASEDSRAFSAQSGAQGAGHRPPPAATS